MSDYPAIPEPTYDTPALYNTVKALKEAVERLTGQRGDEDVTGEETDEVALRAVRELEETFTTENATLSARIKDVDEVYASETEALARRSTLVEAEIVSARAGQPNLAARVSQVDTARVNGDSALASSVNSLTTTVGNNTASITNLTSSVNGISVRYAVTGNINGVTGGFVFSGVQQNSGGPVFNLEINSNVVINGNVLVNGTLTTNKYGDGSVATDKIAASAVSNTAFTATSGAAQFTTLSVPVFVPAGAVLYATASWGQSYLSTLTDYDWTAFLDVNGVPLNSAGGLAIDVSASLSGAISVPGGTTYWVTLTWSGNTNVRIQQRSVMVWVLKR